MPVLTVLTVEIYITSLQPFDLCVPFILRSLQAQVLKFWTNSLPQLETDLWHLQPIISWNPLYRLKTILAKRTENLRSLRAQTVLKVDNAVAGIALKQPSAKSADQGTSLYCCEFQLVRNLGTQQLYSPFRYLYTPTYMWGLCPILIFEPPMD